MAWVGTLLGTAAVGTAVVVGVSRALSSYDTELALAILADSDREVEVPVLVRDVHRGTTLTADDVRLTSLGAAFVAPGTAETVEELVGRTVVDRILAGEPVRTERLAPPESGVGLTAIIPETQRALALNLDDDELVSGFVEPGDSVDLIVTLPGKGDAPIETVTVAQAIPVLAVDEQISPTASGGEIRKSQVTLALAPDVVERITHGMGQGVPKLSLRSEIDLHHRDAHGVRGDLLLGSGDGRITVAEFRERYSDETVRGWVELVAGSRKEREEVAVDPDLLRPVRNRHDTPR